LDGRVEDQFPEWSENSSGFIKVVIVDGSLVFFSVWWVFKEEEHGVSDNDFTDVSPIEGHDKVSVFDIDVEGAVFVGSFNVSVDSNWVIDKDLEIFNWVKEVEDVANPGVHGLNNVERDVEAVGEFFGEIAGSIILRSNNKSIPPGSSLIVSNVFVVDSNTVLSVWVAVSKSLVVSSLESSIFGLWSDSLHVQFSGEWVNKVDKSRSMSIMEVFLNVSQFILRSGRDVSSGVSKL
jgi:hypothetical protein